MAPSAREIALKLDDQSFTRCRDRVNHHSKCDLASQPTTGLYFKVWAHFDLKSWLFVFF
jgi:hypothetical protein